MAIIDRNHNFINHSSSSLTDSGESLDFTPTSNDEHSSINGGPYVDARELFSTMGITQDVAIRQIRQPSASTPQTPVEHPKQDYLTDVGELAPTNGTTQNVTVEQRRQPPALPTTFGEALLVEEYSAVPDLRSRTVTFRNQNPQLAQITDRLGNGAFGAVYRSTDPMTQQDKVVKWNFSYSGLSRVNPHLISEHQMPGEVYAMLLEHPNVLSTEGVVTSSLEGSQYWNKENLDVSQMSGKELRMSVSPFVEGGDASRFLTTDSNNNPVIGNMLYPVLQQAAEGISYLHQNEFLHDDIKPDNLLVDSQGNVKVADPGFLRPQLTSTHIRTGGLHPTGYAAPERYAIQGGFRDQKSDAFAFGITACEIALGKQVTSEFDRLIWMDTMRGHYQNSPDASYLDLQLNDEDKAKLDRLYPGLRPLLNELTNITPFKRISVEQFKQKLSQLNTNH